MIQEVVSVEAELQLLCLAESEVLVKAEVAVEECRSEDFRSHDGSVAPWRHRQREAASVHELILAEPGARIAIDKWPQRNRIRPVDTAGANRIPAGEQRAVGVQVEVAAGIGRQIRAALELSNAGELPPVDNSFREFVVFHGAA